MRHKNHPGCPCCGSTPGVECGCWAPGEVPDVLYATWSLGTITVARTTALDCVNADSTPGCYWEGEGSINLGSVGCFGEDVSVVMGISLCRTDGIFGPQWAIDVWFYGTVISCGSGCETIDPGPDLWLLTYGTSFDPLYDECPLVLEFNKKDELVCETFDPDCTTILCILFPGGGPVTFTA